MERKTPYQSEIGWARVFLSFLKEAEAPSDQIRMRGMGVAWQSDINPRHATNLMEYFQSLDRQKAERCPAIPARAALARQVTGL